MNQTVDQRIKKAALNPLHWGAVFFYIWTVFKFNAWGITDREAGIAVLAALAGLLFGLQIIVISQTDSSGNSD